MQELHKDWDSLLSQTCLYMPSIFHIIYTNMLATIYRRVAEALTEFGECDLGGGIQLTRMWDFINSTVLEFMIGH